MVNAKRLCTGTKAGNAEVSSEQTVHCQEETRIKIEKNTHKLLKSILTSQVKCKLKHWPIFQKLIDNQKLHWFSV